MIRRAEVCFLLCFRGPDGEPKRYEHAGHYLGKPGSSGFLKVRRRLSGGGFSGRGPATLTEYTADGE